ncbi:acyltransferase family protein [Streptomyces sp. enrichment culture]|uniref:acyltransferase family protein n=1 Tax=Streptomyces sp. enrichment culture TaxID=1795815 RepID=UPI003F57A1BC
MPRTTSIRRGSTRTGAGSDRSARTRSSWAQPRSWRVRGGTADGPERPPSLPLATRLLSRAGRRAAGRCSLVLAAAIGAYWGAADGQDSPSLFHGGLFLHALASALLVACLARAPRSPVGRFLGSAPLRRLGTVSYSLYLWHWPVYLLLGEERLGLEGAPRTLVLLAVSVALAHISKVLVEDPVRFRARWAKGRTGAVALVAAFAALAALWTAVPEPRTGKGSVDVTRLVPDGGRRADGRAVVDLHLGAGHSIGVTGRPARYEEEWAWDC